MFPVHYFMGLNILLQYITLAHLNYMCLNNWFLSRYILNAVLSNGNPLPYKKTYAEYDYELRE